MGKIFGIVILILLVGGSWFKFHQSGLRLTEIDADIEVLINEGDRKNEVPKLRGDRQGLEAERTFVGILLTFLTSGLAGIVFVTWLLPIFAQKMTHAVYDSGAVAEMDPFHKARVFMAQGEWEEAIECFREGAKEDSLNRLPYVEIAKIQRVNLEDAEAAVETLRGAIGGQEWEEEDVAFLMFRLAEVYDEDLGNRAAACSILEQVMEQLPGTRHAANAGAKLNEWGIS